MAITISFPKLEAALRKDKKNVKLFYEKGIVILNGIAFAIKTDLIFAINLKEFFITEKGIESDDEIKDLDRILFFLEQKVFTKEYWSELTKMSEMSLIEGNIFIKNPKYSKTLIYESEENNFRSLLDILKLLNSYSEIDVENLSISMDDLLSINSAYSSELKNDVISFTPIEGGYIKFTFKNRKHFYGFLKNKEVLSNDPFKFEMLKEDLLSINQLRSLYPELPEPPNTD